MAVPIFTNSIGSAVFFDLVGAIFSTQQELELIPRPGVDGLGARRTGIRGKEFDLISTTYHTDFAAAKTAMAAYIALKSALQTVTRNSVSYGSFIVLEVTEAKPPYAVYNVAGAPGKTCRAEVKWKLVQP